MRCSYLTILLLTGLLLSVPATLQAQHRQSRRGTPARQSTASRQPQQLTAAGGEVGGDEQQVMARVRGYQSQLEREEKALSQRMAYAAQLRRQGLEKKDQNLLDQAEQYERRALAAYQGRVKLFEKTNLNPGSSARVPTAAKNPKAVKNLPSQTRPQPRRRSSRNRSAKSAWSWLR